MDSPDLDGIAMCQSGVVTQPLNDRMPAGMQRSGVAVVEQRSGAALPRLHAFVKHLDYSLLYRFGAQVFSEPE
jgi:hypothetical protein